MKGLLDNLKKKQQQLVETNPKLNDKVRRADLIEVLSSIVKMPKKFFYDYVGSFIEKTKGYLLSNII